MWVLIDPPDIAKVTRERTLKYILRLGVRRILLLCQLLRDVGRSFASCQVEARSKILVLRHRGICVNC